MVQGRSTKTISMITWFRTSRLSIKNSLYSCQIPLMCTGTVRSFLLQVGGSLTMRACSRASGSTVQARRAEPLPATAVEATRLAVPRFLANPERDRAQSWLELLGCQVTRSAAACTVFFFFFITLKPRVE